MLNLPVWACWQERVSYASIVYQDLQASFIADTFSNFGRLLYIADVCCNKLIIIVLQSWILLRGSIHSQHPIPSLHACRNLFRTKCNPKYANTCKLTSRKTLAIALPMACVLATPEMTARGFDAAMQYVEQSEDREYLRYVIGSADPTRTVIAGDAVSVSCAKQLLDF